ncbi:MAG: hypothetical protein WAJ88_01515, partial [Pseudolabrys sp.]
ICSLATIEAKITSRIGLTAARSPEPRRIKYVQVPKSIRSGGYIVFYDCGWKPFENQRKAEP